MSTIAAVTGSFVGTGPYKIVTATQTANATAGTIQANASASFATNLPLGMGMNITDVEWVAAVQTRPILASAAQITSWQIIAQITEALGRTSVSQLDPLDVDIYFDEIAYQVKQATAAGLTFAAENRQKAIERHKLQRAWLTVAQNLRLVTSLIPEADNTQNGPNVTVFCRIYYDLITLTAAQQSYLASRIQIAGQV